MITIKIKDVEYTMEEAKAIYTELHKIFANTAYAYRPDVNLYSTLVEKLTCLK